MKNDKLPQRIIVVPYNPEWKIIFDEIHAVYSQHVGDLALAIEHVGSTSVVGLAAKPILDIDIIVKDKNDLETVLKKMTELGYHHVGDYGIKGREVLKRKAENIPFTPSNRTWMRHHLYVCVQGVSSLQNHLTLRNYLRKHPEAVQAYGNLKLELAQRFPYDIDLYIEHKTPLITSILEKGGFDPEVLESIREQNKAK